MLTDLREINRVLLGAHELSTENGAPIENVIKHCAGIALEGRMANHQDTINFCMSVGLLRRKYNRIIISDVGEQFLFYNKEKKYTLNDKQKKLLSMNCFLKGKLAKEVQSILEQFRPDHGKLTFVWSKEFEVKLEADNNLLSLLVQSEVLFQSRDIYLVNPQYAYLVSSFKASHKMTKEELEERLAEHNEVGSVAEDIVVDFEKKRLLDAKCEMESDRVLNISSIDVSAGFDVMSFDGKNFDHDKFIEVKGSRGTEISFIISKNEIEVARKKGKQYWLYFVGGVDVDKKTSSMTPQMFQDPINTILGNAKFEQDCLKILVKQKPQNNP